MDFSRKHRLADALDDLDDPDDRPDGVHCVIFVNNTDETITIGGGPNQWAPTLLPPGVIASAGEPFVVGSDAPLKIEPSSGPPPPEFREIMIDGKPTVVLIETRCMSAEEAAALGLPSFAWATDAPRPGYRSIWDVYGLRRRPRRGVTKR